MALRDQFLEVPRFAYLFVVSSLKVFHESSVFKFINKYLHRELK